MDPILNFTDKVILITGAASGFGKQLSAEAAQRGAKLVLGDLNEAGVQAVAEELKAQGSEVVAQRCDVSKEADCKALVDSAREAFGKLDIAVNNAGIPTDMKPLQDTDEAEMDQQFNINAKGVFFGMKYQIPLMREAGEGSVLNVSSMAGLGGAPKIASYAAAKHAVVGLTKTAAVEYGRKGVRVNAICPFFSLTPMITDSTMAKDVNPEDIEAFLGQASPMKRLGTPEEIVNVMLMMISPVNTFMNGQTIAVDGGISAF